MTTRAARALLSEMHPCDDRDNAHSTPGGTWHMSSNRMGSMLDAVERQAVEAAPPSDPAAPLDVERHRGTLSATYVANDELRLSLDRLREAAQHAAAVLNSCGDIYFHAGCNEAGAALRAALATPEEGR